MPEQLHYTCPICPLGNLLEYDADCDDYICQGCLLSAPGPVLVRIAEGQRARGAVVALEAQLEAAREAIEPGQLAAADGYVHVAIQRLDAARAEAVARANHLPGLTATLEELRHQRVDLAVQLRAMVANWDETGEELGFCRSDALALADAFDRRDVASMLDYERAGYLRGREDGRRDMMAVKWFGAQARDGKHPAYIEGREAERRDTMALADNRIAMANALKRFGGSGGGILQGFRDELEQGLHVDGAWRKGGADV